MSEKITIDDQITYLEACAKMLQSQQDMIQVQIKFLKAGKDIQNANPFLSMFDTMNPFLNQFKK